MVLVKEFRIVMPFSMAEYRLGQRYSVAKTNNQATKGSDGIELVKDEPWEDKEKGRKGRYTFKIYHLEGYLPGWMKAILPGSAMKLEEESFDSFPYTKTILTNPFLGGRFSFTIESFHIDGDLGQQDNVLSLPPEVLADRKVQHLDICTDPITNKDNYKEEEDPAKVSSKTLNKGPLKSGWQKDSKPVMCAYKVVTVKVSFWPFSGKAESYIMSTEEQIFLRFHKQIFSWMDEWFNLDLEELIAKEKAIYAEMNKKLQKKPAEGESATAPTAATAAAVPTADAEAGEEKPKKKKKKHTKKKDGAPEADEADEEPPEPEPEEKENSESEEEAPEADDKPKRKKKKKAKQPSEPTDE